MVSMAQNRSLNEVLNAVVRGIADCPSLVLARLWLIDRGDICQVCRLQPECPDPTHCLHLVASAGNPRSSKEDYSRLDGAFRRFPLGVRKIGRVAKSGEGLLITNIRGDEDWIADPLWIQRQRVKSFAAQPLVFRGQVLGVLAIFDAGVLSVSDFNWLRVFADHAAVSIANARAFEEIEFLKARLEEENQYLRQEVSTVLGVGNVIGNSLGLTKVIHQIQLVAPTEATVLITGESGTGKELVARAIHDNSTRKDRALIKVNCAAVPESLFESEFFGHVKGSFTGALKDKPGRFELAHGGTLFLDEIGEIPLPMQTKLLRVLQEQEIERVGDTRTRKINVRLIAATHRDLKRDVQAGRFRQDLFYRLSVFPIEIPPLRERRDDIPQLVEHFVTQCAQRLNHPSPRLTQSVINQLKAYDWPGNVRELQNSVERAVILAQGRPLRFDFLSNPTNPNPSTRAPITDDPDIESSSVLTRDDLKRHERDNITHALQRSGGKIFGAEGAAELLGMKPTTLASRIKALGIHRKPANKP